MCATFTAYLHNKHNRIPYLFAYINTVGSEWVEQALESKWTECDEQRSGEKRLCWVCFCTKTKCTVHWIVRFVIMWTADMLVFVFMCVSVYGWQNFGGLLLSFAKWSMLPCSFALNGMQHSCSLSILVAKSQASTMERIERIQNIKIITERSVCVLF